MMATRDLGRRTLDWLAAAVLALVLAGHAHAATMAACEEGEPAARVAACTAILADSANDGTIKARALVGRAYAVLFQSNDNATALIDFTAAAELDPGNAEAFIGKGKMHFFHHRLDEAEAAFTTATRLAPDNPMAWNTLGKVYYRRGDFAVALGYFERAIQADRRNPNANMNRADALYLLGRKGEALAGFRFCLYLFGKHDRQYAHVAEMIDRIENELAAQ